MSTIPTNNEIKIAEIEQAIAKHNTVLPHCKTRADAEDVEESIIALEEEKERLELLCKYI